MRVAINHQTIYRYPTPANYSIHYLRLTPLSGPEQRVLSWKVNGPGTLRPWVDAYGNSSHVLVIDEPHREIRISAVGEVEIADGGKPLLGEGDIPPDLFLRSTPLTTACDRVRGFADGFRPAVTHNARKGLDLLIGGIRDTVAVRAGNGHAAASARETLEARTGSSQDRAHLFVTCCRSLGVPARYVSGYQCADTEGEGAISHHAWAEAFVDGAGWQGFDVDSRMSNARAHVRVAIGLDALDASPVRGWRRGGSNDDVEVETIIVDARTVVAKQSQKQVQQ